MSEYEQITWAGRTLAGTDRFGRWKVHSLDGWHDSPDSKGETSDIPNGDGEQDLPIYNEARIITVTGRVWAKSHADLHEAGAWLTGAVKGRFQVGGHGPDQWADAKRTSGVKFVPATSDFAHWQISLKAVDPIKYGDMKAFAIPSGAAYVELYHRGNTASLPTITVSGSAPGGYEIQSSAGARYQVTRALSAGSPHTIDFRDGMLQMSDMYVPGIGARADIWRIPAGLSGTNIRVTPLSGGSPTAVVSVTDSSI